MVTPYLLRGGTHSGGEGKPPEQPRVGEDIHIGTGSCSTEGEQSQKSLLQRFGRRTVSNGSALWLESLMGPHPWCDRVARSRVRCQFFFFISLARAHSVNEPIGNSKMHIVRSARFFNVSLVAHNLRGSRITFMSVGRRISFIGLSSATGLTANCLNAAHR